MASIASSADSGVNARAVRGFGTPARESASEVRALSPQVSTTSARFTQVVPAASSARVA